LSTINDSGVPIKFGGEPALLDYAIYTNHLSTAWAEINRPLMFLVFLFEDWHGALSWLQAQPLNPGPIFSMLIGLAGYEENRNLLSWIYQIAGAILGWHWYMWIRDRGEALWLQIVSACFPLCFGIICLKAGSHCK
jgi:hypothetical protein